MRYLPLAGAVLFALNPLASQAEEAFPATLVGHAYLPAMTFIPAPEDAPAMFSTSGKFAGPGNTRNAQLYSVEGNSFLAAEGAPRLTGISLPFVGQPVQGFSGIRYLGDGEYLVLVDNGFGSSANSPDAMLQFHKVRPDWETGKVTLTESVFLHDPDAILPFPIVTEASSSRYLTGADFDLESIQPVGDHYWFGDEFGPYVFATDAQGKVVDFHPAVVAGEVVQSPDNHAVRMPATPAEVAYPVRRSRGFEGMAVSVDGSTLYPLFEGPLWDAEAGNWENHEGREYLRIIAFDIESREFTGQEWKYLLEENGHNIGDFNMIDEHRGLIIERDGGEGDAAMACEGEPRSECFNRPALFKRVYMVDFSQTDENGFVKKVGYVDLLDIDDPEGVARIGGGDGKFSFPFVTIEDVDRVDEEHIIVANDNNLPFSSGRTLGENDHNEFILLHVPAFLNAR